MKRPRSFTESLPGLGRIIQRFWPYIRRQRVLVAGSFAALFAEVIFRALEPWPLKYIFDSFLGGKHGKHLPFTAAVEGLSPTALLTVSALAIVVFTALHALAEYANTIGFAIVGNRVLTQVRAELFRHLQSLSLSFHTNARSGDLVVRVMGDVNLLKDATVTAFLPLLANFLVVLGMVGVMFWLHWKLALVALSTLPLFWLCTRRFVPRIQQAARAQRHKESAMAATVAETVTAIKTVQALSLERLFGESFLHRNNESLKADVKGARLSAALSRSIGFLVAASVALVLWYGGRLVLRGELTAGELLVFVTYLRNTFRPVRDFAKYTGRLAKASAAGERVLHLLAQKPEVCDLPGAMPAAPFRGAIRFDNVTFGYESKRPVLDEIEFDVQPGTHVALVGPSGIGKSTIANLIMRFYDPTHGRVLIDGRDIREYTLESLRAQVSVVLQDTLLFAASARENIGFGMPAATVEKIEGAARLANAHPFIEALPEGYDTVLGERGVTLSGGQRQRVAIARAAIRQTPILILDEPATGLDEGNERMVLEALERLARSRTTIWITHDLRLASRAALILYIEKGRVAERGRHDQLMSLDGRYANLYRKQMETRQLDDTAVGDSSALDEETIVLPAPQPLLLASEGDG
jgi:ATP-binding cassette subfamily B protein